MATAAQVSGLATKAGEPAPAGAAGTAELFAALIAGIAPKGEGAPVEGDDTPSEESADLDPADTGADTVAALLPMLDQQRAAMVAPEVVPLTAVDISTTVVGGPGQPIEPRDIDPTGPTPIGTGGPAKAPEGKPTPPAALIAEMKSVSADSAGKARSEPPAPSALPVADAKAPATKSTSPHPLGVPAQPKDTIVARPLASAIKDAPQPDTLAVKPAASAAVANPGDPAVKAVQAAPTPAVAPRPVPADAVPAAPSLIAQTNAPAVAAIAPSGQAVSETVKASPAVAGFIPTRPVRAQSIPAKIGTDAVPAKAADPAQPIAQAVVQPVAETTPPTIPLAAAPVPATAPINTPIAAPAQNLGAEIAAQVLDLSRGGAWIDQLARDISQSAARDGVMRFRLTPESLGELRVEITHSERGAHVRMAVSSEAAQQALAAAEHKLTSEARAQGVRIAETEISFAGGQSQGREAERQAQAQQQHNQPQRAPRAGNPSSPSTTHEGAQLAGRQRTDRYA